MKPTDHGWRALFSPTSADFGLVCLDSQGAPRVLTAYDAEVMRTILEPVAEMRRGRKR